MLTNPKLLGSQGIGAKATPHLFIPCVLCVPLGMLWLQAPHSDIQVANRVVLSQTRDQRSPFPGRHLDRYD